VGWQCKTYCFHFLLFPKTLTFYSSLSESHGKNLRHSKNTKKKTKSTYDMCLYLNLSFGKFKHNLIKGIVLQCTISTT